MWRDIKRIIQHSHHFLITTHINPDGDGIGAAAALTELLLNLKKKVRFICDSAIPDKFRFLDFHNTHSIYHSEQGVFPVDVLFVLDTNRLDRIGKMAALVDHPGITTICIDHHQISHKIFTPHSVIDLQACSVGAMIYTLYKECGYELNLQAAIGIYASIISDTGRFSYGSTSRKAHKLADECLKLGVDPSFMHAQLFQQVPLESVKIFANSLQRMEYYFNHRVLLQQILYEECNTFNQDALFCDLEFIHEFNKSIKGVECAVVLFELPENKVRISLRSNSGIDIVKPMKALGGGGHPNAAGALVTGTICEVKQRILSLLEKNFTEPQDRNAMAFRTS